MPGLRPGKRMTDSERRVLALLKAMEGKTISSVAVGIAAIGRAPNPDRKYKYENRACVEVYRLRGKISKHWRIRAVYGIGYVLERIIIQPGDSEWLERKLAQMRRRQRSRQSRNTRPQSSAQFSMRG